MKELLIFIRPDHYFKTKEALSLNRFFSMSTKEVLGRGKEPVHFKSVDDENDRDAVYEDSFVAKKMIDMIVSDDSVDSVIKIILENNSNETNGDGKIFVLPVEEVVRIHTKEMNEDALL